VVRQALTFRAQPERGGRSAVLAELTRRLRDEGLTVLEGMGHGPHAVDVAVASEDDDQLLAVAVDSDVHPGDVDAAPGRDDVRLRHEQLTRMGWVPLRVRSTDVFTDPAREVARVLQAQREAAARQEE
jgi:very-short-patch-repair endonuclease